MSNSTSVIVKITITALYGKADSQTYLQAKCPSKLCDDVMFHQSFCFIKDCHPSNVAFLQRSSSINVHILSKGQFQLKVVYRSMSFCIKDQRPSSIHHYQPPPHNSRHHQPSPYTLLSGTITHSEHIIDSNESSSHPGLWYCSLEIPFL